MERVAMNNFSTISCYAALTVCSKEDIFRAYTRMVIALVQDKQYDKCDIEELCQDFERFYGFALPYHPMQAIINECIKLGYFAYNSSTHQCLPNYATMVQEDFMDIVKSKDQEFQDLLHGFKDFLVKSHNLYCSTEDLEEKIYAFVERYGISATSDKSVLSRVKDDFFLAEYLVYCEENGQHEVLDYLDEYTIGLSLSEVFTYSQRPETYTAKDAHVYLDTSILFRLLGIGSSNHAKSYLQFIRNMQHLGMHMMVYDHTIIEMIGIIENSKQWIGNPEYDANLCSEATFFFVSNNWTIDQIDEFSGSLRTKLKNDFNITTDNMSYPRAEDIHTKYEAEIKELIVETYQESGSTVNLEDIDYTINQDAKSIFYTQHRNGNIVPYHIDDIKNIFITTNRSLAKVGYNLSYEIASSKQYFIPLVMTDITWGTLIWFNSPATLSSINRPRLVSAAYAAFRPSSELIKKLNATLSKLEEDGKVTPEQCYFLKVSPVAQRLLAERTINDPDKFVELTPLEILKILERDAYEQGSISRQKEVDELNERVAESDFQLAIAIQRNVIATCERDYEIAKNKVSNLRDKKNSLSITLNDQKKVEALIDSIVKKRMKMLKGITTIVAIILALGAIYIGDEWSWIIGVIPLLLSIFMFITTLWKGNHVSVLSLFSYIEQKIKGRQNSLRRFSPEDFSKCNQEYEQISQDLCLAVEEESRAFTDLKNEKSKLDQYSADISILQN